MDDPEFPESEFTMPKPDLSFAGARSAVDAVLQIARDHPYPVTIKVHDDRFPNVNIAVLDEHSQRLEGIFQDSGTHLTFTVKRPLYESFDLIRGKLSNIFSKDPAS